MKKQLCCSIFAWALLHVMISHSLNAQPNRFEWAYGGQTCWESGMRGVEPIDLPGGCCDAGYIAVGISNESVNGSFCTSDFNVYVVRTDITGAHVWENVYDIGNGSIDSGICIREVEGGFIIAGVTAPFVWGTTTDIFLMKIDCLGNLMWTKTYGVEGANDFAYDLIVAEYGNGTTTNPGDFVVAGWTDRGCQNQNDGLLLRTTSNGTLIWNKTYHAPGTDPDQHNEYFRALIETKKIGVGDIVAAGYSDTWQFVNGNFFGEQGFVVRVDGNNGSIGLPPQGAAHYGGNSNDNFEAVQELSTATEAGNLVFAGHTSLPSQREDIYLVKTTPDPCQMTAQNVVGTTLVGTIALGMVEVHTPAIPFCPVGDLAVVGRTTLLCEPPGQPSFHSNAILLHVASSNLQGITGFQFGQQLDCRSEAFWSVKDVANGDQGFIMCGFTHETPASPTDPMDLYLVKTDGNGRTGCEEEWIFFNPAEPWEEECVIPTHDSPLEEETVLPTRGEKFMPERVCTVNGSGTGGGPSPSIQTPNDDPGILEPNLPNAVDFSFSKSLDRKSALGGQSTTTGTTQAKAIE